MVRDAGVYANVGGSRLSLDGKTRDGGNIKAGKPPVSVARERLVARIAEAQKSGTAVLKIIHGYGSTGTGGKLRIGLRKTLEQLALEGRLRSIVRGEDWDIFDPASQRLLGAYDELSADEDLGRSNPGITIVELRRKGRTRGEPFL